MGEITTKASRGNMPKACLCLKENYAQRDTGQIKQQFVILLLEGKLNYNSILYIG